MMIIIMGKSGSGKDSVEKELEQHGYNKISKWTTRPMRQNEIQDITYHFTTIEDFKDKLNNGFFLLYRSYNTSDGIWYYGLSKEDFECANEKSCIILTPDEYKEFLQIKNYPHKSFYIYANQKTIKRRLSDRGDKKEEAARRLEQDNIDFKGVEKIVDKIVYNNDGDTIKKVVNTIFHYLKEDKI